MTNKYGKYLLLSTLAFLWSCSYVEEYIDRLETRTYNKPLARVGNTYLYHNDIPDIVPKGSTSQDSAVIMNKYIESWATRQLVLLEAQKTISSEDLTKEVNEFKELLLQGKYNQMVLSSMLDTVITDEELKAYYDQHTENFLLTKDIILWSYLPVTYCDEALQKKLRKAFARNTAPRMNTQKQTDSLRAVWTWKGSIEEIMAEESYNAPLVTDQWIETERISNTYITPQGFMYDVKHTSPYVFTLHREDDTYLCKSTRYLKSGEVAPIEYVETQIRTIILNKRKIETIKTSQENLKKEALNNNNFEIFTDNEDN